MSRDGELLATADPEESTPTPLASRLRRAGALYDERRLPEAELELSEAIRLAPEDLRAWRLLARVRLRLGRLDDARAAFAAIAARAPQDGEARLQAGLCALKVGDFTAAAGELEAAVRLLPDDKRAAQYLGYAWARLGRVVEARATLLDAGATQLGDFVAAQTAAAAPAEMPVASLAARVLLPPETGAVGAIELAPGVHRLVVEADSETHVTAAALLSLLGEVSVVPVSRRRPGRLGEADGGDQAGLGLLRCQGQGEVWLGAAGPGAPVTSLRLEDDVLYVREDRVLGFAGDLAWEGGAVPGGGPRLLHFHGRGVVVVDFAAADVVAIRVSLAHRPKLLESRLLGWLGRVVLQPPAEDSAPHLRGSPGSSPRAPRVVTCEGEGVLLIARHGQAQQPVHQRAESGHHGPGGADSGDSDLHR